MFDPKIDLPGNAVPCTESTQALVAYIATLIRRGNTRDAIDLLQAMWNDMQNDRLKVIRTPTGTATK